MCFFIIFIVISVAHKHIVAKIGIIIFKEIKWVAILENINEPAPKQRIIVDFKEIKEEIFSSLICTL